MKKIKVLALIMVFAFAALGGAYAALWSDEIALTSNVKTGNVDLKWGNCYTGDLADAGDDYHAGSPLDLKDGEDSVARLLEDGTANPNATDSPRAPGIRRNVGHIAIASQSDDNLVVNITNAYPDYQGEIEAYVVNAGSIPVILNSLTATAPDGTAIADWLDYNVTVINDSQTYAQAQLVQEDALVGTILEASEDQGATKHDTKDADATWGNIDNKVKVKISVHVAGATNLNVPQKTNAAIKFTIQGTQWNGVNVTNPGIDSNNLDLLDLPNSIVARFD